MIQLLERLRARIKNIEDATSSWGKHIKHWGKLASTYLKDMRIDAICSKSRYRENGLALWDVIVKTNNPIDVGIAGVDGPVEDLGKNTEWVDFNNISERNRYNHSNSTDIKIPNSIDLVNNIGGFSFYEAAHVLAHMWADACYSLYNAEIRDNMYPLILYKAFAHTAISYLYGVPFYTRDIGIAKRLIIPKAHGIEIIPVTKIQGNKIYIPINKLLAKEHLDNTISFVFVLIQLYPPPDNNPLNEAAIKFSLGPYRAIVVGWETADYIYSLPVVYRKYSNKKCIAIHINNLLPASSLKEYVEEARIHLPSTMSYSNVVDWLASSDYSFAQITTPPLPDKHFLNYLKVWDNNPEMAYKGQDDKIKEVKKEYYDSIKTAIMDYECSLLFNKDMKYVRAMRATRNTNYKVKMENIADDKKRFKSRLNRNR